MTNVHAIRRYIESVRDSVMQNVRESARDALMRNVRTVRRCMKSARDSVVTICAQVGDTSEVCAIPP